MTMFAKSLKFDKPLNRRSLLKGVGAAGLGAAFGGMWSFGNRVTAQDAATLPIALKRITSGDLTMLLLQENMFVFDAPILGGGAPDGAVSELLARYNQPSEQVTVDINLMVLQFGGETILVDTGTGQNTVASLEAAGVTPESVNRVVLSHWHPDHVGGVSSNGAVNFPNASYHFPQTDWDTLQAATDDTSKGALASLQPAFDAGVLEFYSAGELLPGLEAVAAPGHTPGHHAFLVSAGAAPLLLTSDTAVHPITALTHTDWAFGFDGDPAQAAETRAALLERIASEKLQIMSYHFPFPGIGYIANVDGVFRFSASA